MATPIKNPAGIDYHARRVNFSGDHALGFNLHAALGKNYTVEAPGNHHTIAFNLPLDFRAVPQNHGLFRNDVAFHISIDTERSADRKRSFEGYALIDESCPLFVRCAIL